MMTDEPVCESFFPGCIFFKVSSANKSSVCMKRCPLALLMFAANA